MSFATNYIEKNKGRFWANSPLLSSKTNIVIVVPCLNEPDVFLTLDSLTQNLAPQTAVAVIVVVNHSENANNDVKVQNQKTVDTIQKYYKTYSNWLTFHCLYAQNLPNKWAGAGWARKIGMDWAISHFNRVNNPNGIIVSLDADSIVAPNYICEIERFFTDNPKHAAATIYFEHQLTNFPQQHLKAIAYYELYMRYYKNALAYTGFKQAMYTVGSCFAVTAKAYVAQGGMNRKKAGEDFYFLNKIAQFGDIGEIITTCVFPSARISDRVPFGTGPTIAKYLNGTINLELTYPFEAFLVLKNFFEHIDQIYTYGPLIASNNFNNNPTFVQFLNNSGVLAQLQELAVNCSNIGVFKKRFFHVFDAFQVLKWLNFAITENYHKGELLKEVEKLLSQMQGKEVSSNNDIHVALRLIRDLDKQKN